MLWTKEQLPLHIRSKPEHILKAGLLVANAALSKGLSEDEATFVCLQRIKSLESQLKPKVEPRVVPSHIAQLLKQNVLAKESQGVIQQAFLGKNALVPNEDRNLVQADFNSSNELVLTFNTGERIITSAVNIEKYLRSVNTGIQGPRGADGTSTISGTAELDFGTSNKTAEVIVTGVPGVLTTSRVIATTRIETTANHSEDDLLVDPIRTSVKSLVEGVGFTIYGEMDNAPANGLYKVDWFLSN
jgi:hypothetical protein